MSKTFQEQLRALRDRAGLSQSALAQRAGVDPTYLGRVERGAYSPPKTITIRKIADALGLNPDEEALLLHSAGRSIVPTAGRPSWQSRPDQLHREISQQPHDLGTVEADVEGACISAQSETFGATSANCPEELPRRYDLGTVVREARTQLETASHLTSQLTAVIGTLNRLTSVLAHQCANEPAAAWLARGQGQPSKPRAGLTSRRPYRRKHSKAGQAKG